MPLTPGAPPRPEVWVNCAASADGRLAFASGARARLSSPEDLVRVQRLRSACDAILVGVGTVVKDDPSLRVHWELLGETPRPDPLRVVVDGSGRTPPVARVLDATAPTLVAMTLGSRRTFPGHVRTFRAGAVRVDLPAVLARLSADGVRRVLVEGGAEILGSVLRGRLFDRWSVYYAPTVIGAGDAPPIVGGDAARSFAETVDLELEGVERLGAGYAATYRPRPRQP